nr:transcriptional repressor LexA [Alkalibaculum sporogenes]
MSGKSRTLTKNYRTTTQISSAAYKLIENDETIKNNVDFIKPSLLDRQGAPPTYKYFKDNLTQQNFITHEINHLKSDYKLSDICIVAKENRLLDSILNGLQEANIPCELLNQTEPDFESEKVKIVTMHSIKGLEFKVIFLINLDEGVIPNNKIYDIDDEETIESEERKLLYVGMTRANELLYMTSVNKPSKFIKDIGFNNLRLRRDCSIRAFQSIGIPNYLLTEQIMDVNSKEEVIRQWMIKELNETYGYPLDLIELEYQVQQFSNSGYVDIAVDIYFNGQVVPYLFIEIKRFGSGIETAMKQLKSYMQANNYVRYGIATDGIDIIVINREEEVINDIPRCQPNFLPQTKEQKIFHSFKTNRQFHYSFEKNDEENYSVQDIETDLMLDYPDSYKIPVLGNVAAGIPITVNTEYDQYITLPTEWMIKPQNTFALRVNGDSMSGIGINKGNIVIVNRQDHVANGDIVIAVIDQEATMKKFMSMGDTILLISENPAYEPIQMQREDIVINGKVIGVLKD